MEITTSLDVPDRPAWRAWLLAHHSEATGVWVLLGPPPRTVVRLGYVEEVRRQPLEFGRRLANLVRNTEKNGQFGNWNDGGRLTEPEP